MKVSTAKKRIRMQEMAAIVASCQESGLTVKAWCAQNSINEGSYYYWLHRIREETLRANGLETPEEENAIVPVELPEIKKNSHSSVRIEYRDFWLEIPAGTNPSDIIAILKAA